MGRTNPTFRDYLRRFKENLRPFRKALRSTYQTHFDRLLEQADRFSHATGYLNSMDPDRAILLSMLLGHEADIDDLEDRVADLEDDLVEDEPR